MLGALNKKRAPKRPFLSNRQETIRSDAEWQPAGLSGSRQHQQR